MRTAKIAHSNQLLINPLGPNHRWTQASMRTRGYTIIGRIRKRGSCSEKRAWILKKWKAVHLHRRYPLPRESKTWIRTDYMMITKWRSSQRSVSYRSKKGSWTSRCKRNSTIRRCMTICTRKGWSICKGDNRRRGRQDWMRYMIK